MTKRLERWNDFGATSRTEACTAEAGVLHVVPYGANDDGQKLCGPVEEPWTDILLPAECAVSLTQHAVSALVHVSSLKGKVLRGAIGDSPEDQQGCHSFTIKIVLVEVGVNL